MAAGKAPFAHKLQKTGKGWAQKVMNIHHRKPIESGGGVYDLDNLAIVSPRYHLGMHHR